MKKILTVLFLLPILAIAQIYEPEGLNMPGEWNSWNNPPANLVLASSTQVTGGTVTPISAAIKKWQTAFSVAASGGNIVGGTYEFLFTSGPLAGAFSNKWSNVTVSMDQIQTYTFQNPNNNSITITDGKYYVMNWLDSGYGDTDALFMELSAVPILVTSVSDDYATVGDGNDVTVSITTSGTPPIEQVIYVRYTTDAWGTSGFVLASGSGTTWSATIPAVGNPAETGTNNNYYVLTTTSSAVTNNTLSHANADMLTINFNNNGGTNYALPVELTTFTAKSVDGSVLLNWETATEVNNYGFDVEASNDKENWNLVGFVEGHGNSTSANSYSFVVTDNSQYYRLKQIDTDGGIEYSDVVEVASNLSYKLAQNHPNPFNPSTQISFSIPEVAKVQVTVYNALGQEIAELANREFAAGNHSVNFNASGLSSGLYFYRLNSANFSQTMKMLLLK